MSQEQANPTNRALVLVLAVLAGVIILGFGGCAGLGLLGYFLANRAEEQAEQADAEVNQALREAQDKARLIRDNPEHAELIQGLPSGEERANAQFTIQVFFEHLRERRLESAYDLTSAAYQERQSRAEFDKWVEAHPGLRRPFGSYGMQRPRVAGEKVLRFRYASPIRDKLRVEVTIGILRENDLWRIEEIELREEALP